MKVIVPLDETQIAIALREYVVRQGFARASAVHLDYAPGDRPNDAAVFSAKVDAETKDPER